MKPTILLKNFSYNADLSEETNAYTAIVNVDGVDAIYASNHGTGGCDDYTPIVYTPVARARFKTAMGKLETYAKSLPPKTCQYFPEGRPYDVELLIDELVEAKNQEKHEKARKAKMLKKSINHMFLVAKDGSISTIKYQKPIAEVLVKFPDLVDLAKAKYPDDVVIHGDFETVIWPAIKDKL